eukprot:scaffold153781_cov22-Tisochrysis_lutea.AAC.1
MASAEQKARRRQGLMWSHQGIVQRGSSETRWPTLCRSDGVSLPSPVHGRWLLPGLPALEGDDRNPVHANKDACNSGCMVRLQM